MIAKLYDKTFFPVLLFVSQWLDSRAYSSGILGAPKELVVMTTVELYWLVRSGCSKTSCVISAPECLANYIYGV